MVIPMVSYMMLVNMRARGWHRIGQKESGLISSLDGKGLGYKLRRFKEMTLGSGNECPLVRTTNSSA